MDLLERVQAVRDAIVEVQQLVESVDEAVRGTRLEANYRAYGRYGFDTLLGNGNQYDSSLETLLSELKEEHRNYCKAGVCKGDTVMYREKKQVVKNIATDEVTGEYGTMLLLMPLASWVNSAEVKIVED